MLRVDLYLGIYPNEKMTLGRIDDANFLIKEKASTTGLADANLSLESG